MPPQPRRVSSIQWESGKAMLSLAGIRQLKQATISVNASTDGTYTVTEPGTRRVVAIHGGAAFTDIRFNMNAAADGTKMPVVAQRYFVVDARAAHSVPGQGSFAADVLHFFNASAGTLTVYIMEIE